ncbi:MAG: hypothetical protein AAFP88_02755, partial [Bacteroidota bacterium]
MPVFLVRRSWGLERFGPAGYYCSYYLFLQCLLIKQKLVDIEEKNEKSENLLGIIVPDPYTQEKSALIQFLLSEACEGTDIKELLYMENKKGQIPYEIAIAQKD